MSLEQWVTMAACGSMLEHVLSLVNDRSHQGVMQGNGLSLVQGDKTQRYQLQWDTTPPG